MTPQSSLYLPNPIKDQQLHFLNSPIGLYQLFDKLQASNLFSIPENSLVINLDNITFGPDRYTIVTDNTQDVSFKVMYYALLYFIFQRKRDEKSNKAYQKLLEYIINNQMDVQSIEPRFTQQEVKVYLVKFLQILSSGRDRRKLVIEELNNLPQINLLFIELIKQISEVRSLWFQENARKAELNILNKLGIKIDLLSYELFLLEDEFQIEMRHFQEKTEFAVIKDTQENITRIREEFFMGESAYFTEEMMGSQLQGKRRKWIKTSRVIKKSTIKSVEWDGGLDEDDGNGREEEKEEEQGDFNKKDKFQSFFQIQNEGKECNQSEEHTNVESQPQKPKPLSFHEIINGTTQKPTQIIQPPIQTLRSRLFNQPQDICSSTSLQSRVMRKRFHKQSLQLNPFTPLLGESFSTKCIKSQGFMTMKQRQARNTRRVPTFILNRVKAKTQKIQQMLQPRLPASFHVISSSKSLKDLKITFTYRQ